MVQSFTESEAYSLTKHNHTMTFGGDFKRQDRNTTTDQNARGTFVFSGLATSEIANGQPVPNTGFDFADFLLGLPQSSSVQFGGASTYFRQNVWDVYANDDWRVNPNLTLMFGLRYEYYSPLSEKYGHLANLDIAPDFTAVAPSFPANRAIFRRISRSLIEPDRDDWAPRGGLAWKPFTKHSTVVRVGYGIYYNPTALNRLATELSEQPPFAATQTLTTSTTDVLTLQQRSGHRAHQRHGQRTPTRSRRITRWATRRAGTSACSKTSRRSFFVELSYLGTKGTDLDTDTVPNRAAPGSSPLTSQQNLQIANAEQFIYDSSWGNSIYHAGQAAPDAALRAQHVVQHHSTRFRNPSTTAPPLAALETSWRRMRSTSAPSAACRASTGRMC